MRRLAKLLSHFQRDERGAFAVIFAMMAIVLVALSGSVVDYVSLEQTRNRTQIALDAATLALQPEIFKTPLNRDDIKSRAQALVLDRLGSDPSFSASLFDPVIDVVNGTLTLEAALTVRTAFVSLVGVPELNVRVASQATRKKLALEVAFVLDNSGSMDFTQDGTNRTRKRMQFLKDAANCATYTLFYDAVETRSDAPESCVATATAKRVENVRLAVVPFNMFVNVGAGNASAAWIDKTGVSVTSNDNFDTDDNQNTLPGSSGTPAVPNRFELFAATKEAWRGCVEARPHIKTGSHSTEYLDTDDTPPTTGNTLFVPMLAPDYVDNVIAGSNLNRNLNSYLNDMPAICDRPAQGATRCSITEQRTRSRNYWGSWSNWSGGEQLGNGRPSGPTNFTSNTLFTGAFYGGYPPGCSCRGTVTYTSNWAGGNYAQTRDGYCSSYVPEGLSNRDLQERLCKYHGPVAGSSFGKGPNADCVRTAIQPLSDDPSKTVDVINSMSAEGGTNIHQGAVWGYHVLSKSLPFDQGGLFSTSTSKVMIIMTDGENTAYNLDTHCDSVQRNLNGSCYNSAYGLPYNSRNSNAGSSSSGNYERMGPLGASNANLVTEMNTRTTQTCENAKRAGITVYTIGLATDQAVQSTQAVVQKMLRDCASTAEKAYFPSNPNELTAVFASIANELSALRLSQ